MPAPVSPRSPARTAVALILVCAAGRAAADAAPLSLTEIAPGAYVHTGAFADLEDPGRGDSANIGFIVGHRCVAVIDTGGSLATGAALRAAIRTVTPLPVCYVINTHAHFDHVLGNAAFADDGPEFVGHENLRPAIAASRDYFIARFAAELGGTPDAAQVVGPTRLVQGSLDLDLGNRVLRLATVATAHTAHDLTVVDVATRTLWAGDLVFMQRLPVIDGSLKGWLAWIDAAAAIDYALTVPGHGPASAPWPQAVVPLQTYLAQLLRQTRAAVAAGEDLDEATRSVGRDRLAGWVLTAHAHPRNVSKAYLELEWE